MILLRNGYMVVCCLAVILMAAQGEQEARSVCNSKLMISNDYQAVPPGVFVGNSDIHARSLSAWTWRVNFDEDRIPKTISEAVCSSNYCVDPTSGPNWTQHDAKLNSVPIPQSLLVLRFNETLECYQTSFITVTVGCACVRARTV